HTRFSRDWSSDVCSSDLSEAIVTANLDTIESHEGEEDISIDVQLDEIINLIDALNAFGINAINDAQTMDALTIYIHAQTMDEARSEERRVGKECEHRWAT